MDRREEATLGGGDFREAVIELYGIASWWAYHARELREAVERWRDDGWWRRRRAKVGWA